MEYCKNCNNGISGNYCSNCGQPVKLKRIDAHYILHEITHVLHFDHGIFYTIKQLLVKPGQSIRTFISEDRSRLVKPVLFIVISSLIYSVINHFFDIDEGYIKFTDTPDGNGSSEKTAVSMIFGWIQNHYGYANIIIGIFIALWLQLFFRKYKYNFYELLILLCFVIGVTMLLLSVFTLFQGVTKVPVLQASAVLVVIYTSWAIGQFFDKNRFLNYIKSLASYALGMMTFTFSALILGLVYDYLKHKI